MGCPLSGPVSSRVFETPSVNPVSDPTCQYGTRVLLYGRSQRERHKSFLEKEYIELINSKPQNPVGELTVVCIIQDVGPSNRTEGPNTSQFFRVYRIDVPSAVTSVRQSILYYKNLSIFPVSSQHSRPYLGRSLVVPCPIHSVTRPGSRQVVVLSLVDCLGLQCSLPQLTLSVESLIPQCVRLVSDEKCPGFRVVVPV